MLRALSMLALASVATARVASYNATQTLTYDYIIIGAGTSGLVIANRLSELNNVTVAVIEAGDSVLNNTDVSSPSGYGLAFGTDIDWQYETTNQTYAGGLKQTMRAGKAIGGTSTINGLAYTRAEDIQIDAWETIGNEGWNWASLFPYYKKSSNLTLPSETQVEVGATYDPADNGFDGPLVIGWKNGLVVNDAHAVLNETYAALNVPWNEDINGGRMRGINLFPSTVDPEENVRTDAARAYYYPADRNNLHMYANTFAQRIVWVSEASVPTASGVEVIAVNSSTSYIISAKAEVIVSAGALASPLILELSGIGNPAILNKYNISVVVDLPTVGENLQDNMNTEYSANVSSSNASFSGSPTYVAYPTAADIFGSDFGNTSATVLAALPSYAEKVARASGNVTKASDLLNLFKAQHELIFSEEHAVPVAEMLITPSATAYTVEFWALLPFARGNIHIASPIPGAPAAINPNYFMLDWDVTGQVQTAKFIREVFATEPLAPFVGAETAPGLDVVPANATEAEWFNFIKDAYRSNFHPVATAAMMPQEMGGVVDTNLKVYGTSNVRVVDASVLPFQVCGHLVSTLYAVAERAADLIKSEM